MIKDTSIVKVTKMNHVIEVQHSLRVNRQVHIKKLNKHEYVDLTTGEVKGFNLSETRKDNLNSLRQTFKKLRYLINNNFVGRSNELHVTLTYKDNMTDTKRLYVDFKRFMTRLKRKYFETTTIDYISVVEPQKRGAWHCHVLMRFNDLESVYLSNEECFNLWEQGFVKIHSLKNVDNIGAYLSAYLSDVEFDSLQDCEFVRNSSDVIVKNVNGEEKKFIKGARLHLYPTNMKLFRKSKGILEPVRQDIPFRDIKKIVGSAKPNYSKSYEYERDNFTNTCTFLQYNLKRLILEDKKE